MTARCWRCGKFVTGRSTFAWFYAVRPNSTDLGREAVPSCNRHVGILYGWPWNDRRLQRAYSRQVGVAA